jgi:rubrerythrin
MTTRAKAEICRDIRRKFDLSPSSEIALGRLHNDSLERLERELTERETNVRIGRPSQMVRCGECGERFLARDVENRKECPKCGAKRADQ